LVLTWLSPEKAVAIARDAHRRGFGSPDGTYDIDVQEQGPAERDTGGVVITESYLSNRMEF